MPSCTGNVLTDIVFFLFVMAIVSLYTTLWILSHLYTMVVGN